MEKEYEAVADALPNPEHKQEQHRQLDPTEDKHRQIPDARQIVEIREDFGGMLRLHELVDRPGEHDGEDGQAQGEKRPWETLVVL